MNQEKIDKVVAEMVRVTIAIAAYRERGEYSRWQGSKEGGALRRASMDLTRALAELRK